jgi:cupin fold WbuC family metalloprotein
LLIFDGDGLLLERTRVAADGDTVLYEMPAGVYHTLVPQSDHSFFFEVKPGPYDPSVAAEFAAWAPAEGTIEAETFAARLRSLEVGDSAAT